MTKPIAPILVNRILFCTLNIEKPQSKLKKNPKW